MGTGSFALRVRKSVQRKIAISHRNPGRSCHKNRSTVKGQKSAIRGAPTDTFCVPLSGENRVPISVPINVSLIAKLTPERFHLSFHFAPAGGRKRGCDPIRLSPLAKNVIGKNVITQAPIFRIS